MRILDERGRIDPTLGDHGESARTARDTVETARRLESLPEIAAAAYEGALSCGAVERGHQAGRRGLAMGSGRGGHRTWRRSSWRGWRATRRSRRRRIRVSGTRRGRCGCGGHPTRACCTCTASCPTCWAPRSKPRSRSSPSSASRPRVRRGTASNTAPPTPSCNCATNPRWETRPRPWHPGRWCRCTCPRTARRRSPGIPIADSLLEQLRANATIEPVLVDDDGTPIFIGKRIPAISPKIARAVLLRDGHCRCSDTCDVTWGLQVHHLRPRSWGGTDDPSNLAAVAALHHSDAHPSRTLGAGRQPQPARRSRHASTSTTSRPNNANRPASHHAAPDRTPHEPEGARPVRRAAGDGPRTRTGPHHR